MSDYSLNIKDTTELKNTLIKSALVGVSTFFVFGAAAAMTVAAANVVFSSIVTPAENNKWFDGKNFKDITHKENTYMYKILAVRTILYIIPLFWGINLLSGQGQYIMELLIKMYEASNYTAVATLITHICLIAPVAEEIIFRGLILEKLRDIQALIWGKDAISNQNCIDFRVNLQAVLFGLAHYHPKNTVNKSIVAVTMLMGQILGYIKEKTNDLISPIAIHAANNISTTGTQIFCHQVIPIKA